MTIEDASPALQLLMQHHHAEYWENGPGETTRIAVPVGGRGNPTELRPISCTMLEAAQRQIDTGTPALRGELDFKEPPKRTSVGRPKYDSRKVRR